MLEQPHLATQAAVMTSFKERKLRSTVAAFLYSCDLDDGVCERVRRQRQLLTRTLLSASGTHSSGGNTLADARLLDALARLAREEPRTKLCRLTFRCSAVGSVCGAAKPLTAWRRRRG